jgi:hypothetical protein
VVIFNVHDKQKELDFNFDNRPHHFIDIESGDEIKVHPGKMREAITSLNHTLLNVIVWCRLVNG